MVIGGGNSAVVLPEAPEGLARGTVRILCVTDKMMAVKEDGVEALKEGIHIDYNVKALEILGDGQ